MSGPAGGVPHSMFIRNLDHFTLALGLETPDGQPLAPLIFDLASLPFQTDEQRNQFTRDLTGLDFKQRGTYVE